MQTRFLRRWKNPVLAAANRPRPRFTADGITKRGIGTVETRYKIDDTLVDELTEQLFKQMEQQTAFPPSEEKCGASGGE